MHVGTVIRNRRESLGLRQEDLAERTGLARNTISRIEIGTVDPSASSMEILAKHLDCTVAELYPSPEPAPRNIGEALFRARVRDRLLSLDLPEIRDLFRTPYGGLVDYDEAYDLATRALQLKSAFDKEVAPYRSEIRVKNLMISARDRALLACLEYEAIALETIDRAKLANDHETVERVFNEFFEVRQHTERLF